MNSAGHSKTAGSDFRTTHWSVVLSAGKEQGTSSTRALNSLCQTYWYPLYVFARRKGYPHEQAQDLTQAFFAKILEKNQISMAEPGRGRFRTFLLHSMENFLRSAHRAASAQKRGGGCEVISLDAETAVRRYEERPGELPAAVAFEREWAGTLLDTVLAALKREFSTNGKGELFTLLEPHLWGDDNSTSYATIAKELQMSPVAVRVTLHRLRQRFHALLRAAIADTVEDPTDIDDEIRHLRRALAG